MTSLGISIALVCLFPASLFVVRVLKGLIGRPSSQEARNAWDVICSEPVRIRRDSFDEICDESLDCDSAVTLAQWQESVEEDRAICANLDSAIRCGHFHYVNE